MNSLTTLWLSAILLATAAASDPKEKSTGSDSAKTGYDSSKGGDSNSKIPSLPSIKDIGAGSESGKGSKKEPKRLSSGGGIISKHTGYASDSNLKKGPKDSGSDKRFGSIFGSDRDLKRGPKGYGSDKGSGAGYGERDLKRGPEGFKSDKGFGNKFTGYGSGGGTKGYRPDKGFGGRDTGYGFDRKDIGRDTGYGLDRKDNGRDTGYGFDRKDNGRDTDYGFDRNDNGRATGYGFDRKDNGRDTGYGFGRKDNGRDTGYGFDRKDNGRDTGYGFDRKDNGRDTGYGSDRNDNGRDTGYGFERNDNSRDTGYGFDRNDNGRGTGYGFDRSDNGRDKGYGFDSNNNGRGRGYGPDRGDNGRDKDFGSKRSYAGGPATFDEGSGRSGTGFLRGYDDGDSDGYAGDDSYGSRGGPGEYRGPQRGYGPIVVPSLPATRPLDDLDKIFFRLRAALIQIKIFSEMVDALAARLSLQKQFVDELVLVTTVALKETDERQDNLIVELWEQLGELMTDVDELTYNVDFLYKQNQQNIEDQETAENLFAMQRRIDVQQDRDILRLDTEATIFKDQLIQVQTNYFESFKDVVQLATVRLSSIKARENRRMCETGRVSLISGLRVEYSYQTQFHTVPQVVVGTCGFTIQLNVDRGSSFADPYSPRPPTSLGGRVIAYSTKTALILQEVNLTFGSAKRTGADTCFQACSIDPGSEGVGEWVD